MAALEEQKRTAMAGIRLYRIWHGINSRCNNPNEPAYRHYGGRGIKVIWPDFESFFDDMYQSHAFDLTLDRIDNNGHYSKANCRWATLLEQANNRQDSRLIEYQGKKMTVCQWPRHLGMKSSTVRQRFYVNKWSMDKIVNTPVRVWGSNRG